MWHSKEDVRTHVPQRYKPYAENIEKRLIFGGGYTGT